MITQLSPLYVVIEVTIAKKYRLLSYTMSGGLKYCFSLETHVVLLESMVAFLQENDKKFSLLSIDGKVII